MKSSLRLHTHSKITSFDVWTLNITTNSQVLHFKFIVFMFFGLQTIILNYSRRYLSLGPNCDNKQRTHDLCQSFHGHNSMRANDRNWISIKVDIFIRDSRFSISFNIDACLISIHFMQISVSIFFSFKLLLWYFLSLRIIRSEYFKKESRIFFHTIHMLFDLNLMDSVNW